MEFSIIDRPRLHSLVMDWKFTDDRVQSYYSFYYWYAWFSLCDAMPNWPCDSAVTQPHRQNRCAYNAMLPAEAPLVRAHELPQSNILDITCHSQLLHVQTSVHD